MSRVVFFSLFLFCFVNFVFSGAFERGLEFYNNRGNNRIGYRAKPEFIDRALQTFLKAYYEHPTEKTAEYVLRSYYFKGNFTEPDADKREKIFEEGKNFGLKAIEKFPNSAEILYYHAINYGKWGEHVGLLIGLKEDAADNLKRYFEKVIELDPLAVECGGYRILAVINYQIPYIPFVVSWPSEEVAESCLKKSLKYYPNNLSNNFFYAEFLDIEDRQEEAVPYLKKIIASKPRNTYVVEDTWAIIKAKELLNKIEQ